MRVAMVASECEPFAKTGGLADVVDALSRALGRLGHEVDVYLPAYRGVEPPGPTEELSLDIPGPEGSTALRLLSAPADGYRLRLVEHPPSFDRPDYYVANGADYLDNGFRFSLLGRAALESMRAEGRPADVLHGHDWESVPAILLLRHRYGDDEQIGRMPTVLTCHNLAYHGWVPRSRVASQLDLPSTVGASDGVDLLREGILAADLVNTVSPTYARESVEPGGGAGVEDALASLGDRYIGILNGIDTQLWDPAIDAALAQAYSLEDPSGKRACRRALCAELGLDPGGPLLGMIGRLDPQKGFDLLAAAAPTLIGDGARICALGTGDQALLAELSSLAARHPDRLAVVPRFDRDLARRIYAGVDAFVMPSRFEPCGQGQMIAMRYGSPPIVRLTGGLADTVIDADRAPAAGNGFTFDAATPEALLDACRRAMTAMSDLRRWSELCQRGMAADFGWAAPAEAYLAAYRRAADWLATRR